jgi:hydrogenase-1 operon protein HyaF
MNSTDPAGPRDYPFYGNVRPLLNEILHAVDRLLETGEPTTIDLATLPFGPGELEHLEATLGSGELCATLDSLGTSHIRETAYPGVWWLEHRNAADEVVGRFLEVTRTPEILSSQDADITAGRARLEDQLDQDITAGG